MHTHGFVCLLEPGEGISIRDAVELAGVAERTMRAWCLDHALGVMVGGRWRVSRVALMMMLAGDREALRGYRDGDRNSARVRSYFAKCEIAI